MPESLPIGVTLPTSGPAADASGLAALAQAAEDLGFDSVWLSDHVVVPEQITSAYPYSPDGQFPTRPTQAYLEPLASLAFLAGMTRRIRLGTHVLILPYRHPLLTTKMIASIDQLSGGRFDLGIGVGWMREEFLSLGCSEDMYTHRGAVTDEQLRIFKSMWTEDVADFNGRFYQFERLGAHPQPVQKPYPPIWVGGHTPAALRRTARYADGWLPIGARPPADLPPDELAAGIATIRTEAERAGRNPDAIRVCFSTHVNLDPGAEARPFTGSPEQVASQFERYRAVGVDRFVIGLGAHPPAEYERRMRQFADQLRPLLAGRVAT